MNGTQMAQEMGEQPDRLRRLIDRLDPIAEQVRAAAPVPLRGITIPRSTTAGSS